MKILALDTSTPLGSLALLHQKEVRAVAHLPLGETYSRTILPALLELLAREGWSVQDLALIAVDIGPGSFTGLRIGLSVAKGLAWAAGKPLLGVSSLDALVQALPPGHDLVCPVVDARHRQLYAAFYRWSSVGPPPAGPHRALSAGFYGRLTEPAAYAPDQLIKLVTGETVFIGDGLVRWGAHLAEELGSRYIRGPAELDHPSAVAVARVALSLCSTGVETRPTHVSPLYLRPADIREPKAVLGSINQCCSFNR